MRFFLSDLSWIPGFMSEDLVMQRIVFLDRSTVEATFRAPAFDHSWIDHDFTPAEETVARLEGATIAITNKVRIGEAELALLPDLRMIAVAATGMDILDLEACRRRNITVSNVTNYASAAVAEHTFALILALSKNLIGWREDVLAKKWHRSKIFCLTGRPVRSLENATLGLIGYGSIAREVERLGRAFGMQVLIAERRGHPVREGRRAFEDVLSRSDVLSLHAPLDEHTKHLIGEAELRAMKPSALLINTARGALIEEQAVLRALDNRWIAGVALDVLQTEPPRDTPLLEATRDDLLVTPHVAWRSTAAQQALADQIVDAMERFATTV
jgi:glycerate dehydrogenase